MPSDDVDSGIPPTIPAPDDLQDGGSTNKWRVTWSTRIPRGCNLTWTHNGAKMYAKCTSTQWRRIKQQVQRSREDVVYGMVSRVRPTVSSDEVPDGDESGPAPPSPSGLRDVFPVGVQQCPLELLDKLMEYLALQRQFAITSRTYYTCENSGCEKILGLNSTPDVHNSLLLQFGKSTGGRSRATTDLQDLLNARTQPHIKEDATCPYCQTCDRFLERTTFLTVPNYLFVALQRRAIGNYDPNAAKDARQVTFSQKHTIEIKNRAVSLELVGVICHRGAKWARGHYVAYVLRQEQGAQQWYEADDDRITKTTFAKIQEKGDQVYLFVFATRRGRKAPALQLAPGQPARLANPPENLVCYANSLVQLWSSTCPDIQGMAEVRQPLQQLLASMNDDRKSVHTCIPLITAINLQAKNAQMVTHVLSQNRTDPGKRQTKGRGPRPKQSRRPPGKHQPSKKKAAAQGTPTGHRGEKRGSQDGRSPSPGSVPNMGSGLADVNIMNVIRNPRPRRRTRST